jgi:hypothetical protein
MMIDPPYSPDIAPSDFFFHLFGGVKVLLTGESFEAGEDLLSAVEVILGALEKLILSRVSLEWKTRLERCIDTNDDCVG